MITHTIDTILEKIREIESIFSTHNANQLREMPRSAANRVRELRKEVTELTEEVAESMKEMYDN